MPRLKGQRVQPRKSDQETFHLFDLDYKPKSLIEEETPPRFATVIESHGYTDDPELRANFVRYLEDFLLPAGLGRKNKNIVTVAEQSARAYRFYEQLVYLHKLMIDRMNEPDSDHAVLLETFKQDARALEPDMKDAVKQALKAINRIKHYTDEDLAMLIEIPFMALRGSKSLAIIANKRGTFYDQWAKKYPHLWTLRKGIAEFADFYSGEGKDEDEDLDHHEIFPLGFNYVDFHKSPRPIWWGDMNLGPFSRICRRLVKIKKADRKKRLHTPAMLLYWRTRPKPSQMLGSHDDYRT